MRQMGTDEEGLFEFIQLDLCINIIRLFTEESVHVLCVTQ